MNRSFSSIYHSPLTVSIGDKIGKTIEHDVATAGVSILHKAQVGGCSPSGIHPGSW